MLWNVRRGMGPQANKNIKMKKRKLIQELKADIAAIVEPQSEFSLRGYNTEFCIAHQVEQTKINCCLLLRRDICY
jgi:hypothetical protein